MSHSKSVLFGFLLMMMHEAKKFSLPFWIYLQWNTRSICSIDRQAVRNESCDSAVYWLANIGSLSLWEIKYSLKSISSCNCWTICYRSKDLPEPVWPLMKQRYGEHLPLISVKYSTMSALSSKITSSNPSGFVFTSDVELRASYIGFWCTNRISWGFTNF